MLLGDLVLELDGIITRCQELSSYASSLKRRIDTIEASVPPQTPPKSETSPTKQIEAVSTKEAARLLGVKRATLSSWRNVGQGPKFNKQGSRVMYRIVDLQEWQIANSYSSTAEVTTKQTAASKSPAPSGSRPITNQPEAPAATAG